MTNPCEGIRRLYKNTRAEKIWTDADLCHFQAQASKEVFAALKLATLTGIRLGDLLELRWDDVLSDAIEFSTRKSGMAARAQIPLYAELRKFLATLPRLGSTVLVSTKGTAWSNGGFGASFNRAKKAANIDLHFHDARGTAATNFYRANLTAREIAAIMGWKESYVERILDKYVHRLSILNNLSDRISIGSAAQL